MVPLEASQLAELNYDMIPINGDGRPMPFNGYSYYLKRRDVACERDTRSYVRGAFRIIIGKNKFKVGGARPVAATLSIA